MGHIRANHQRGLLFRESQAALTPRQRELLFSEIEERCYTRLRLFKQLPISTSTKRSRTTTTPAPTSVACCLAMSNRSRSLAVELDPPRYLVMGTTAGDAMLFDTYSFEDYPGSAQPSSPALRTPGPIATARRAHTGRIYGASWFPFDEGMFFTAGIDGTVKIWDTQRFEPTVSLPITKTVFDVQMSPCDAGSNLLAVASSDRGVRMVDLNTGSVVHTLPGHSSRVKAVAWSPIRSELLASGSADGTVRLWDVRRPRGCLSECITPAELVIPTPPAPATTTNEQEQPRGKNSKPKRQRSAARSTRETISAHLASIETPRAHYGECSGLLWTPAGDRLISSGTDGATRAWSFEDGNEKPRLAMSFPKFELPHVAPPFQPMTMSRNGHCLYQPRGPDVYLFSTRTGAPLAPPLRGYFSSVLACLSHPHSDDLYTVDKDGFALLWSSKPAQTPPSGSHWVDDPESDVD